MSAGLILAGRYRLISKLGQGGMGSVWRAEDMNLSAEVAIKLIDAAFAGSTEALKRFKREAQAAASIRSTYVVQILDHGIDNGTPFIAMELLNGESLAQRLESVGKLSAEQTGRLLGHVGRALALAHEHGIVHRDMKPENVFLVREDEDEVGKVLDFGIARQSGGLSDSGGLKTQTGAILGTPYYMSPEQATGQGVDRLTDIWAYGLIAAECLTGRRAFDSESLGGLFHAICMAPMPVPSQICQVPLGFDEWFARTSARDKLQRFQTIKEAAAELRVICGRESGLMSAGVLASVRGGIAPSAAISATSSRAQSAQAEAPPAFQTTAVPSARSIPGLPQPRRARTGIVLAAVGLIGIAGIYVAWRSMNRTETTAASAAPVSELAPSVVAAVPTAGSHSAAMVASVAPVPVPIVLVNADAGADANMPRDRAIATPQAAFAGKRRTAAAAAPPPAPAPAPAAAKNPLPAAKLKTPAAAPQKRDDNAAGI